MCTFHIFTPISTLWVITINTYYRHTSNISRTKTQNLSVSRFVLQLCSTDPVASFTKEVKPRLAERPLKINGRLTNHGLASLVKEAIVVLSWEWRCSWSRADRQCSIYIWVNNNFIAYKGAIYIRGLAVHMHHITIKHGNYFSKLAKYCII